MSIQINNNSFSSGTLVVQNNISNITITENITITSPNQFLQINRNTAINGQNFLITVTCQNYPGFIQISTDSVINVLYVNMDSNGGSLVQGGGWLIQKNQNGQQQKYLQYCNNYGNISSDYSGGLVGQNCYNALLEFCSNCGSIEGNYAGGLIGADSNNSQVSQSYNIGNINGMRSGGIFGPSQTCTESNTAYTCYSHCDVNGYQSGGIFGYRQLIGVNACYFFGKLNEQQASGIGFQLINSTVKIERCFLIIQIGRYIQQTQNDGGKSSSETLQYFDVNEISQNGQDQPSTNTQYNYNIGNFSDIFLSFVTPENLFNLTIMEDYLYPLIKMRDTYENTFSYDGNGIQTINTTQFSGIFQYNMFRLGKFSDPNDGSFKTLQGVQIDPNTGQVQITSELQQDTQFYVIGYKQQNQKPITYFMELFTITYDPMLSNQIPQTAGCFTIDSQLLTDQGTIDLKQILQNESLYSIQKKKFIVTQCIPQKLTHLICIGEDFNGNTKLLLTPDHKILYNGRLIESGVLHDLINDKDKIYKKKYNGEILYNILLDQYGIVCINGLQLESLNPDNILAKLYKLEHNKRNQLTKTINDHYQKKHDIKDEIMFQIHLSKEVMHKI